MGLVTDAVGDLLGTGDAARSAERGARITADAQREALEYLKEREALPQAFREEALTGLAGLYGLEGGEGSQADLIERARTSPLYDAILGTQQAGEEAILRHAGATGGLRSGDVQGALTDYGSQLQNQALLEAYNQQVQGLQGLAGLPSYAPQIAQYTADVGRTLGQGQIAAGQASQAELGQLLGLGLGAAQIAFSDRRLKSHPHIIGKSNGHNVYIWLWNKEAEKLGLRGRGIGVMADEIKAVKPEAVQDNGGYSMVDYSKVYEAA